MLACERWTLTHSSGCPVALALGPGLALPLGLVLLGLGLVVLELGLALVLLGLGLATASASSVAAALMASADCQVRENVGEPAPDGGGTVGDDDTGLCWLAPVLGLPVADAVVESLGSAEALGDAELL